MACRTRMTLSSSRSWPSGIRRHSRQAGVGDPLTNYPAYHGSPSAGRSPAAPRSRPIPGRRCRCRTRPGDALEPLAGRTGRPGSASRLGPGGRQRFHRCLGGGRSSPPVISGPPRTRSERRRRRRVCRSGSSTRCPRLGADRVWLMDDDTIPRPTALRALLAAWNRYPGEVRLAGSRVVWTDGRDHPMNTPRTRPGVSAAQLRAARTAGAIPVRSSSFVSMLISADAVKKHGLPIADYFLWNDDFEYSCRLLRRGVGLRVPASVVEHRTERFGAAETDPGERFYFEVRNKIWMLTRSSALDPAERVLYAAAGMRRWLRTVARSPGRPLLLRAGARGWRDGVLTRPRSNQQALFGLGRSGQGSPMPAPPETASGGRNPTVGAA